MRYHIPLLGAGTLSQSELWYESPYGLVQYSYLGTL